jgi:hypothetical protein
MFRQWIIIGVATPALLAALLAAGPLGADVLSMPEGASEPQSLEPQSLEPQSLEPQSLEPQSFEPQEPHEPQSFEQSFEQSSEQPAYQRPEPSITLPGRGMSMSQVESRFGPPRQKYPEVGEPPIIRWVYRDFTVYFEYQYVINSVAHQLVPTAPTEPAATAPPAADSLY